MANPIFICIPGAWHTPSVFPHVMSLLATHGYASHGLSLPSVGANPGLPDFSAVVTAFQELIDKRISSDEDLVVVSWSYDCAVGTKAVLPSMLESARRAYGNEGGGVHLVYFAASVLPICISIAKSKLRSPQDAGELASFDMELGNDQH